MRKTIDKLYQERLSHVETKPPADVWQNISDRLPQKRKNRTLPLWYTLAGTAAAIVLIFLIFKMDYPGSSPSNNVTTNTFQQNRNSKFDHISPEYHKYMNTASALLEAAALETQLEILKEEFQGPGKHGDRDQGNNQTLASTGANSLPNEKDLNNNPIPEDTYKTEPAPLAQSDKPIQKQVHPFPENESKTEKTPGEVQKDQISIENEGIAITEHSGQNKTEEKFREDISKETDNSRRFRVTPTAAAVYLGNFGRENLLDDQFSNSDGGGEISMSYGVNLAYQVSEKIKLRSGINKVNLAYNTQEVNYASALNSQAFDFESLENNNSPNEPGNSFSPVGSLRQNMEFIEVPMEIEYVILNKKSGINLIGGFSTLFHETNGVELNSAEFNADLGEANNINNLSFSVNAGVGFNYKITSRFQFNLEPIFKYQINTFSNNSNTNSYYLGIYSGLSFKF